MANILKSYRFIIIFFAGIANASNAKTTVQPLYFGKNQITKVWSGKLSPKQDDVLYQFQASKNQYTTLELFPRKGFAEFANVGVITSPNGKSDGGKGGVVYQGCLPQSGNYRLRMSRNLMATNGGAAGFVAKLTILPVGKSQQKCA